jgi:hypothetical protein
MLRCSATTYILSSFFLPHSYNDLGLSKRSLLLLPKRVFVLLSDTIIVAEVGGESFEKKKTGREATDVEYRLCHLPREKKQGSPCEI